MNPRDQVFAGIRKALRRGELDSERRQALEARLRNPAPSIIPARSRLPRPQIVDLFVRMAVETAATVDRLPDMDAVPDAVASYLAGENLPSELVMAPHPDLQALPWSKRPLLQRREGRAENPDVVGLGAAFAGIAETGTLMMASGPDSPVTINFLPETHLVLLRASRVCGPYEEAWSWLRHSAADGEAFMPRAVNLVTGPSRTGDIEQKLLMGVHGPRRLHILLVDDETT